LSHTYCDKIEYSIWNIDDTSDGDIFH
jgi:hypothetical protein